MEFSTRLSIEKEHRYVERKYSKIYPWDTKFFFHEMEFISQILYKINREKIHIVYAQVHSFSIQTFLRTELYENSEKLTPLKRSLKSNNVFTGKFKNYTKQEQKKLIHFLLILVIDCAKNFITRL